MLRAHTHALLVVNFPYWHKYGVCVYKPHVEKEKERETNTHTHTQSLTHMHTNSHTQTGASEANVSRAECARV
jgi:hypothetical protein